MFMPNTTRTIVHLHTDGSSLGNPGPAGWAVLQDGKVIAKGGITRATNNYAELFAVLQAVKTIPPNSLAVIHTDSQLVIGWLTNGWKSNNPLNSTVIRAIRSWTKVKDLVLDIRWTRGHGTDPGNNLADAIARSEASRIKILNKRALHDV